LLGSLLDAVTAVPSWVAAGRLTLGTDLRRAFPRPGHATAAAGVAVTSAALAALGLFAVAVVPDAEPAGPPAPELRLDPALALIELAMAAVPGAEPSSPAPPSEPAPDTGSGETATAEAAEGGLAMVVSAPAGLASEHLGLSRMSPSATTPTAPVPAPLSAVATSGPEPSGTADVPGLLRLSRTAVLSATPFPAPAPPEVLAVTPIVPTDAGALPLGKGMWLYVPEEIEGGNVDDLVARARQVGLTHVYVRTGSSRGGFYAQPYMDELLPKAHAAGIRVYGWDFPYLDDVDADVTRAMAAITHTAPSGDRLDGFAADIETASEGTNLSAEGAAAYGQRLREAAGPAYPLVAVVPRPSVPMQARYPYAAIIPPFDAVAPMTYWLNRQPDADVVHDIAFLAPFGNPVIPIGQAYDGGPEGGRPGPPPPEEIQRFLGAAQQSGAAGVSFWSWQHASQAIWDTLEAAPEFRWEAGAPEDLRPDQVRALQAQLTRLGYPVAATASWDESTADALRRYQGRAGLPLSGVLDPATLAVIMAPFNPPVGPSRPAGDDRGSIDLGFVELDLPLG
jgi:hypothetical protein